MEKQVPTNPLKYGCSIKVKIPKNSDSKKLEDISFNWCHETYKDPVTRGAGEKGEYYLCFESRHNKELFNPTSFCKSAQKAANELYE